MLSLEPLKAAPRYMWYLPGALPTKPISARNGRPHPFGQPVMRITMASSRSPAASTSASSWFSRPGRQRSLSARASPHVGSATHAIELSRKPVARRAADAEQLVRLQKRLDPGAVRRGDARYHEVLVWREAEIAAMDPGDLAER